MSLHARLSSTYSPPVKTLETAKLPRDLSSVAASWNEHQMRNQRETLLSRLSNYQTPAPEIRKHHRLVLMWNSTPAWVTANGMGIDCPSITLGTLNRFQLLHAEPMHLNLRHLRCSLDHGQTCFPFALLTCSCSPNALPSKFSMCHPYVSLHTRTKKHRQKVDPLPTTGATMLTTNPPLEARFHLSQLTSPPIMPSAVAIKSVTVDAPVAAAAICDVRCFFKSSSAFTSRPADFVSPTPS